MTRAGVVLANGRDSGASQALTESVGRMGIAPLRVARATYFPRAGATSPKPRLAPGGASARLGRRPSASGASQTGSG
jgi:hypothetical protein